MPMHDWSRVHRSLYHDFYLTWVTRLSVRLNAGVLPSTYYSLIETIDDGQKPTFEDLSELDDTSARDEKLGAARFIADSPPHTWLTAPCICPEYAEKVLTIRRSKFNDVVAVVRITTPETKRRPQRFAAFVNWATEVFRRGISLLVVDPFPPERESALSVAGALWREFVQDEMVWPANKPLILMAFHASRWERTAYFEPIAVGDVMPDMPLFLGNDEYVPAPLEASYSDSWGAIPSALKGEVIDPPRND